MHAIAEGATMATTRLLPSMTSRPSAVLCVGVIGLSRSRINTLHLAMERAARRVGRPYKVVEGRGDLTLVDAHLAADLSGDEWSTLFGDGPVVAVVDTGATVPGLPTPHRLTSSFGEDELLHSLDKVVGWRAEPVRTPHTDRVALGTLRQASPFAADLLRRCGDRRAPALLAGYPNGGGSILFDFARQEARAGDRVWERLRGAQELPRMADGDFRPEPLSQTTRTRDLASTLWACGLAARRLALVGAPAQWQRVPLQARGVQDLRAYTCTPLHLHLIDLLDAGPLTPSELCRASGEAGSDLRAFLQAGLFLQVLSWKPARRWLSGARA